MAYVVKRGDTIAQVTQMLNTNWERLKRQNPHAVGQTSTTKHWFLKEGATVRGQSGFQKELNQAVTARKDHNPKDGVASKGQFREYVIQKGDTLWDLGVRRFHVHVDDLIRHNGIENPRLIQPGQRIQIPVPQKRSNEEVVASWYGQKYQGKPMANGERFDMFSSTIAHKELPLGTRVELENPDTGMRVKATVTDRGPFIKGRDVDLSYGLARQLSLVQKGVGKLRMRVLG